MIKPWGKRILNYLLLVYLVQTPDETCGICNSIQEVLCKSYCEKNGTVAYLRDGRRLSCSVKSASSDAEIPRSKKLDKTAVPPKSSTISCYKTFFERLGEHKPAMNITWTQPEQNIYDGYVKGYFITQDQSLYHVSLNIEETAGVSKPIKNHECINFTFNCFGTENELLRYKDILTFTIMSLPMSQRHDRPWNEISMSYTIPDEDKCGNKDETSTAVADETEEGEKEDLDWKKIPIYFSIGILIIGLALLLWKYIQHKKKENERWKKNQNMQHIFMIADTTEDCERWHTIAQKIRDSTAIKVETNWENSEARHKAFVDWYTNSFKMTDAVIFLGGAQELKMLNEDIEIRVAERKEFKILIHYFLQQLDYATKKTIFLTNKIEDKQYVETRKRKNWEVFLINNEQLLEGFYQYLREQSQPKREENKRNFTQTKKKHWFPACVRKKAHENETLNTVGVPEITNSRHDKIATSPV